MNDVSEDEVKFVRLKNGDDVITQLVELTENDITFYMMINPLKVMYVQAPQGVTYMQVVFMPWVFSKICDDQEFMIHAEDVITIANVTEKMREYYWKNSDYFEDNTSREESISEENEESESNEEVNLEEILEAIKTSRRTYH